MAITAILSSILLGFQASTPEQAVRDFLASAAKADLDALARAVQGAKPWPANSLEEARTFLSRAKPTVTALKATTNGNRAKVKLSLRYGFEQRVDTITEVIALAKSGAGWLIVPPIEPTDRTMTGGFVNALSYAFVHPEFIHSGTSARKRTETLSNIKQLGLAVHLLAAENNDVLTFKASELYETTEPYIKVKPLIAESGRKFSINRSVCGKSIALVSDPARTVMLYEGANGKLDFTYGRAAICFVDGHAVLLSPQNPELKRLRWKP